MKILRRTVDTFFYFLCWWFFFANTAAWFASLRWREPDIWSLVLSIIFAFVILIWNFDLDKHKKVDSAE